MALAASSTAGQVAYPPLYSFPPFFTLQANATTLSIQLAQWTSLALNWCAHYRVFFLDVDIAMDDVGSSGATAKPIQSLWSNPAISRRLDAVGRRRVIETMIEEGKAAWEPKPPSKPKPGTLPPNRALIYWRTPEEWGQKIHQWVISTGQNRSIMTFFELTEGDLVEDQDFYQLPPVLLRRALETLVKQGKAQIFEGTERGQGLEGVKFAA
ncbi:ESCRT-II complex, vps25 subunit [Microstroma glucosiphilum]|uniref:ESCRT-II complex subunit VPS25 n=1 Tax=Pseudomicrostroma glucosiphilum TaxID=1684307 RepID=A0A316UBD2_9BASI|nr:ESCRT-II complex, vps25 subunit [Pseudomicrostroma glucosiphilum]PWN22540.1 ESCRT-II complex, vps25 subunit [Pseudomicrostroma glucosiphilum]